MSDKADDSLIVEETARLVTLLGQLVKTKGSSVRSLEKKMGVGDSVFAKLLKGKITLQVRHILMLCQAIEMEPRQFFAAAYGFQPAPLPAPVPEPPPPVDPSEELVTKGELYKVLTQVLVTTQDLTQEQAADLIARLSAKD
jgi:transcriptional regulator with XRE-family HTH domain